MTIRDLLQHKVLVENVDYYNSAFTYRFTFKKEFGPKLNIFKVKDEDIMQLGHYAKVVYHNVDRIGDFVYFLEKKLK